MAIESVFDVLVGGGRLAILFLVILILKALRVKQRGGGALSLASNVTASPEPGGSAPEGDAPDQSPAQAMVPKQPETEQQRLTRMERELAEREAKAKAERVRELAEREAVIKRRQDEEASSAKPDAPPEPAKPQDELLDERARVQDLIKRAEESYSSGVLEEKNFKRIVSSYQQQIIDIDIQLKKKRKGGA
jgi:hypothetical protein